MDTNTLRDKQTTLWDYWKDCFGTRPRHFEAEFWNDENQVDKMLKFCDDWLVCQKVTFEGRERLREDGWMIQEDQ